MSWEAQRWTAKAPSELYHTLGPHGVDDLIRQAIAAVWRELPAEGRNFDTARAGAREVLDRNVAVWRRIKKVTPEAFFADLLPHEADGHVRKAMVTTWMMMPRSGGREVTDALRIVTQIFDRNMEAWAEDNRTFTSGAKFNAKPKRAAAAKAKAKAKTKAPAKAAKAQKPTAKKPAKKK